MSNYPDTGLYHSFQFTREAVLAATEKFLNHVGYKLHPLSPKRVAQPDFHARRPDGKEVYDMVGIVHTSLGQVIEGYAQLAAVQDSLGDNADYALVLPPVKEFFLVQFLTAEKGKWFFEIKKHNFMMWICNPQQEAMWCIISWPRDQLLNNYFVHAERPFDSYIAMLLSRQLMENGDF